MRQGWEGCETNNSNNKNNKNRQQKAKALVTARKPSMTDDHKEILVLQQ